MSKQQLRAKAGHTYVRGATAAAMLIPLAALAGGIKLLNHNETVVGIRRGLNLGNHNETVVRHGVKLGNHNETVVRAA